MRVSLYAGGLPHSYPHDRAALIRPSLLSKFARRSASVGGTEPMEMKEMLGKTRLRGVDTCSCIPTSASAAFILRIDARFMIVVIDGKSNTDPCVGYFFEPLPCVQFTLPRGVLPVMMTTAPSTGLDCIHHQAHTSCVGWVCMMGTSHLLEGIFSEELTGSFWLVLLGMPKKMGVQALSSLGVPYYHLSRIHAGWTPYIGVYNHFYLIQYTHVYQGETNATEEQA